MTLRGKHHPGSGGGPPCSLTATPGPPCSVPAAYVWPDGLDTWRQPQLLKNMAVLNLINSTQRQLLRGGSVMPVSLISLMRAEGAGPHSELVAQNKWVCLAPSWTIISAFRGRTALCHHLGKGLSLPSPGRSGALSRVPTWTNVPELSSSRCVFLSKENSESHHTGWTFNPLEPEPSSVGIPAPIKGRF